GAALAENRVAARIGEDAGGRARELPVARVAHALRGLDREEAAALDREVERFAGFLDRGWRHVRIGLAEGHARAQRAHGRGSLRARHEQFPEAVLRGLVGL